MIDAIFRRAGNRIRGKVGAGVLIATFTNGCVAHSIGQVGSQPQSVHDQQPEPAAKAPGIIVHIDPQTGRIITPPVTSQPGQIQQPPLAAKPQQPPLQEKLSPVLGGGVMIELDDRFSTPLSATIDADGKVRFEHKTTMPSANDSN